MIDVYLLPGIDGTGALFAPFVKCAPAWANPVVVPYDNSVERDYQELALEVSKIVDAERPHVLIGESFSGPVAILAAAKSPKNLLAIALAASFIANPRPLLSALLPDTALPWLVKRVRSRAAITRLLASRNAPDELVNATVSVLQAVPRKIVVWRLNAIRSIDVSKELSNLGCPLLYLRAMRDKVVPRAAFTRVRRSRSDVIRSDVDAPHLLLQTAPDAAWAAIARLTGNG